MTAIFQGELTISNINGIYLSDMGYTRKLEIFYGRYFLFF